LLAWCAASRIRVDGPWAQPSITLVALLAALVLTPATAYLYLAHPDWAWLYLVDASRVPRMFVIPAAAASAGALLGGYYGVGRLLGSGMAPRPLAAVIAAAGLCAAACTVIARGRLLRYGSFRDFHAGHAVPLFTVKLGFVLVALAVGVAVAIAYTAWELLRDGRRASAH
jgi:hypothetical protein